MLATKMLKRLRLAKNALDFVRAAHTDVKVPDFSKHMRASVAHPESKAADTDESRKFFTYLMSSLALTGGFYGAKSELIRYALFLAASADVKALARIEINLDEIPENEQMTFKWRGRPLFVWHRTSTAVEAVRAIPLSILRDPERDEDRVQDPRFLVVVGVCTHLGCIPVSHQGHYGGYYCPCHGSHFDISGRARQGPAPSNLEVPFYTIDGNKLTVG